VRAASPPRWSPSPKIERLELRSAERPALSSASCRRGMMPPQHSRSATANCSPSQRRLEKMLSSGHRGACRRRTAERTSHLPCVCPRPNLPSKRRLARAPEIGELSSLIRARYARIHQREFGSTRPRSTDPDRSSANHSRALTMPFALRLRVRVNCESLRQGERNGQEDGPSVRSKR
jgi:hypothetical protein